MDPELLELLGRIGDLTDAELKDLESRLVDEFDRLDKEPKTPDVVAAMGDITSGVDNVRGEVVAREEAGAAAESQAAELRSRIHPVDDVTPDGEEGNDDAEDEEPDGVAGDTKDPLLTPDESGSPATGTPPVAKVAAAKIGKVSLTKRPSLSAANRHRPAARRPSERMADQARSQVLARRTVGSIANGDPITTRTEFVSLMHDSIRRIIGSNGSGEEVLVASINVDYPEDRRLGTDPGENAAKIDAVTSLNALVASGGTCNPVNVDYSVAVFSTNDEPLGDSLPRFQATRGGLRFVSPPTMATVGAAGTTLWTEANDVALNAPAVKPIQRIYCATEQEVYVDAIPTRIVVGNMMGRFSPEITDANIKLAETNAAQFREINRLKLIASKSTAVSTGQLLGAARDLLATLDQAAAAARWRNRLGHSFPLRAVLPSWTMDMVRADLVREIGHGEDVAQTFALSDADVGAMLSARNIQVTWLLDGLAANGAQGFGYQGFGAQATGALVDWPRNIVWWLFAEGTFQLLDGGKLDIGVVRDSTLNNTNDYEVFTEVFEAIAFRGIESLQLNTAVRPNGLSAGTVSTISY